MKARGRKADARLEVSGDDKSPSLSERSPASPGAIQNVDQGTGKTIPLEIGPASADVAAQALSEADFLRQESRAAFQKLAEIRKNEVLDFPEIWKQLRLRLKAIGIKDVESFKSGYLKLFQMGFLPDAPEDDETDTCAVICGEGTEPGKPTPCTVAFEPWPWKNGKFSATVLCPNIEEIERLEQLKARQPKRPTEKAPSLWNRDLNEPSHILSKAIAQRRGELVNMTDPSGLRALAKAHEFLESKPPKPESRARQVLDAFIELCQRGYPPTKAELRESAGVKIYRGMPIDEKQFTRDFLNPLGLYWLPSKKR